MLRAFIPRASSRLLEMGLPRTSWIKLIRLQAGVGRSHSPIAQTKNIF